MNCRHCAIFLLLLGCLFSSPGHADETPPGPCATEWKQVTDSFGKPEYAQATQVANECQTRADEQKKKEFAKTGLSWANELEPITSGGWTLLDISPEGTRATFGSRRHETRKGSVVAVWLRYEYREAKFNNDTSYKSLVQRELYDCERIASKIVSITYYAENNLDGVGPSYTTNEGKLAWDPVIPGTLGDSLLEWACKAPKAQPAKAH